MLGKEQFILKRKYSWLVDSRQYAHNKRAKHFDNEVFSHRSIVLRPLKNVDMMLQQNKFTNLQLAIKHLHNLEIRSGETFSLWKLVGRPTARKGYLTGLVLKKWAHC